jgi:hypothetical protein
MQLNWFQACWHAADAAFVGPGAGESSQSDAPWSLCILRHCRESSGTVAGSSGRRALLAQNVGLREALEQRLRKFSLTLEPTKTKLVEFGRFAHRHSGKRGRKRSETIYFLGFTLYCKREERPHDTGNTARSRGYIAPCRRRPVVAA